MYIDTQRVALRTGDPARASKSTGTDWFLVVPARFGGGDIACTADIGAEAESDALVVELKRDSGERTRPDRVESRDGRTVWIWPASDDTHLCRLVIRGTDDVPAAFLVEQAVEHAVAGERLVLAIGHETYASKLVQVNTYGEPRRDPIVVERDRRRFVASDPRDHVVTRFVALAPGTYELRLTWPAGSDVTKLLARPQRRDHTWIPVRSASSTSEEGVGVVSRFEVQESDGLVRLHFVPSGPVTLPHDIRLVQVLESGGGISVAPQAGGDVAADQAIRGFAVLGDVPSLAPALQAVNEARLQRIFDDDPWLHNYTKNLWELVHGRTELTTYPPDVCVPIADVCNARCTFCTSWLEGTRIATLEEIDGFQQVFTFARWVGLAGHGEPLAHPRIREILARLGAWLDPRADGYVITNGVYLGGLLDDLTRSRIRSFAISLNAASPGTHREVMGLPEGSFDRILDAIRSVVAGGDAHGSRVSISMVITRQNLAEVAAFVDLGNRLGVAKIQLKTLAAVGGPIEGLNYHLLPPYDHPDYKALRADAVAAIRSSGVPVQVDVDSWDVPVLSPQAEEVYRAHPARFVTREEALSDRALRASYRTQLKYHEKTHGRVLEDVHDFDGMNPFGRVPPFACTAPYGHLYINDFSFNLSPCCYLTNVPGAEPAIYGGAGSFMAAWNSQAFVTLRRRLRDGPLFNMCTKCPGTY